MQVQGYVARIECGSGDSHVEHCQQFQSYLKKHIFLDEGILLGETIDQSGLILAEI